MIVRHTNGKWFWFIESDSIWLSTRGMGGVRHTTLHRTLKIMPLGSSKSLRAILFCGGSRRLDLVGLVCGGRGMEVCSI